MIICTNVLAVLDGWVSSSHERGSGAHFGSLRKDLVEHIHGEEVHDLVVHLRLQGCLRPSWSQTYITRG